MTKRIMVDIETMSVHVSEALILSVGAVTFRMPDTDGGILDIFDPRLWILDLGEQLLARRRVDRATQTWWSEQTPEARAHWSSREGKRFTLEEFRSNFAAYVDGCEELWANGIVFDIGNLESLWPESPPWSFRAVRDARTIYKHCTEQIDYQLPVEGEAHDPIADCVLQVHRLRRHGLR